MDLDNLLEQSVLNGINRAIGGVTERKSNSIGDYFFTPSIFAIIGGVIILLVAIVLYFKYFYCNTKRKNFTIFKHFINYDIHIGKELLTFSNLFITLFLAYMIIINAITRNIGGIVHDVVIFVLWRVGTEGFLIIRRIDKKLKNSNPDFNEPNDLTREDISNLIKKKYMEANKPQGVKKPFINNEENNANAKYTKARASKNIVENKTQTNHEKNHKELQNNETKDNNKYCFNCGELLENGDSFCTNCGSKIE